MHFWIADARLLSESLKAVNSTLVPVHANPVDKVWSDRPAAPQDVVITHPIQFSGKPKKKRKE